MFDLRIPTGCFFALAGLILLAMGLISPDTRAPLLDVNINLYCGISMLAFGGLMLALAWRGRRAQS
jgi:hypothetical protein